MLIHGYIRLCASICVHMRTYRVYVRLSGEGYYTCSPLALHIIASLPRRSSPAYILARPPLTTVLGIVLRWVRASPDGWDAVPRNMVAGFGRWLVPNTAPEPGSGATR